jgi:type II secretory pathway component PulC
MPLWLPNNVAAGPSQPVHPVEPDRLLPPKELSMRLFACALAIVLAVAIGGQARAACRDYSLIDADTGEQVDGCVQETVKSTQAKPLSVVPAMLNGVRFGWKIAELSRGDLLARIGLHTGDVLLTLNGYDLAAQATPDKIADVLGANDKLVVTVGSKPRATAPASKVTVTEVAKAGKGLRLDRIPPKSFFANIGLEPGDTILSIAGMPINDVDSLTRMERQAEAMDEVHVVILRAGKELDLLVKVQ